MKAELAGGKRGEIPSWARTIDPAAGTRRVAPAARPAARERARSCAPAASRYQKQNIILQAAKGLWHVALYSQSFRKKNVRYQS